MSYCFKTTILAEICTKMRYFYRKIAKKKSPRAEGSALRPPPPLRNPGYATIREYQL